MVQWRLLGDVSTAEVHVKGSVIVDMSGRCAFGGNLQDSVRAGSKCVIGEGVGGRTELGIAELCLRLREVTKR